MQPEPAVCWRGCSPKQNDGSLVTQQRKNADIILETAVIMNNYTEKRCRSPNPDICKMGGKHRISVLAPRFDENIKR